MSTAYKGKPAEVRALNTFIRLMRGSESMSQHMKKCTATYGLTSSQFAILEALHHLRPPSQADLGRKISRSQADISTILDNLERKTFIDRNRGVVDRRTVTVTLSDTGKKLIKQSFPDHLNKLVRAFKVLKAWEQEELGRICKKLGQSLSDRN